MPTSGYSEMPSDGYSEHDSDEPCLGSEIFDSQPPMGGSATRNVWLTPTRKRAGETAFYAAVAAIKLAEPKVKSLGLQCGIPLWYAELWGAPAVCLHKKAHTLSHRQRCAQAIVRANWLKYQLEQRPSHCCRGQSICHVAEVLYGTPQAAGLFACNLRRTPCVRRGFSNDLERPAWYCQAAVVLRTTARALKRVALPCGAF